MDEKVVARVDLYLDETVTGKLMYGRLKEDDKAAYLVSDEAIFYNLSPGFMKCYLGVVNKCLQEKKKRFLFAGETDKTLLPKLEKDTLFLPDYIKSGSGMAAGKVRDEKDLLGKYEYKYALMTSDELSRKILNAQKTTFVLSYIYFSSQKFYTIFEAEKGTIVFAGYESMSFRGLNDGDFKKISTKIKG